MQKYSHSTHGMIPRHDGEWVRTDDVVYYLKELIEKVNAVKDLLNEYSNEEIK